MNFHTISDSIASVTEQPAVCTICGATARVSGGACVSCLLRSGLGDASDGDAESFEAVLAEIEVRDTEWRLGNYQILEEIGRGGMGVIYRARQRHSKRIVALKRVLSYHGDSHDTLERFRREAQAAASLDHPNILPIYEVGEADGLPFFTMKYATGGSLQAAARALHTEPRECVRLVAKVTRAVAYAHSAGILHRDLKPGNILLDSRAEPLVSDFGLAKWIDASSDLTRSLAIFGTPGFIAPEQAQGPGTGLSPAADVYSLGAILFDLLTGRPPFLGEHALAVIHQAAEKPAPKLRSLVANGDRDMETICAKCLDREPQARYRSAADLAEDLERWLEGRPITARPVSPPGKLWRWSKRNPMLAASVAACLLFGAAGVTERVASSRLSSIVRDAEIARRSVTIAPFEDLDALSNDSDSAHSVTRALHSAFGRTNGMFLRAANMTTTNFDDPWRPEDRKEIGAAAGARMVLTGSVRRRAGRYRSAMHLSESATGSVISTWLEDGEGFADIADASVVQVSTLLGEANAKASAQGSSANRGTGMGAGGTGNAEARSYYERGKEFFFRYNLPDQERAIESLRKAVEIDQDYAQAYAMLSFACQLRSTTDPGGRWLEEAETAAASALRIAPMLPDAHRAHAGNLQRRGNLSASLDPYLTAYELDPANARAAATIGNVYDVLGRPDLAVLWLEKATRRETRPIYADNIGNALTALGEYENAEKAYRSAAIFRPGLPVGALGLSRLALFRGDYETARAECAQARAKYAGNPQPLLMAALVEFFSRQFPAAEKLYREAFASDRTAGVDFAGSVRILSALGFLQQTAGNNPEEGKRLLEEARMLDEKELSSAPDNPRRLYSLAANQAALGETKAALVALEKAIAAGWIDHRSLALDPRFDAIRSSRGFAEILTRLTHKVQEMGRQRQGRKLASNIN